MDREQEDRLVSYISMVAREVGRSADLLEKMLAILGAQTEYQGQTPLRPSH